jgi:hypothetical protein
MSNRRRRIHELVIALISQRPDLDLLDGDSSGPAGSSALTNPANWLERNRRVVQSYQALVRSAVTIDALVDQEAETSLKAGSRS